MFFILEETTHARFLVLNLQIFTNFLFFIDRKKNNMYIIYEVKGMNLYKRERGITLIAVVITVIVLLILAGTSMAMLMGESGVVSKASEASEQNNIDKIIDDAKIDVYEVQVANGGRITEEQFDEILRKHGDLQGERRRKKNYNTRRICNICKSNI